MPTPGAGPNTQVASQANTPSLGITTVTVTVRDATTGDVVSVETRQGPNAPPDPWDNYTFREREEHRKGDPETVIILTENNVTWSGGTPIAGRSRIQIERIMRRRRWRQGGGDKYEEDVAEVIRDSEHESLIVVTDTWFGGSKKRGYEIPLTPPGPPIPRDWPPATRIP